MNEDRNIVVFTTRIKLQILAKSKVWMADGTFGTVPNLFYQLYTIHGMPEMTGKTVPLVFALMSKKDTASYEELLHIVISGIDGTPAVTTVLTDFEQAAITAFRNSLPFAQVTGCFFHFQQSLLRKLNTLGLSDRYCKYSHFSIR